MSFDLLVWKAPVPRWASEVYDLLESFYEERDLAVFAPDPALPRFRAALLAKYPALEDLPDEVLNDGGVHSPWAMTPTESDRLIEIFCVWGAPDAALERIVELAREHDLVLFDPQGPDVHSPAGIRRSPA